MKLKHLYMILALTAGLGACTTPYQQAVSSAPLSERTYEVITKVSVHTNASRKEGYALLSAAETCLARGFSHFSELSREEGIHLASFSFFETFKRRYLLRITFHQEGENIPLTARDCRLIYNSLAPKYINE